MEQKTKKLIKITQQSELF